MTSTAVSVSARCSWTTRSRAATRIDVRLCEGSMSHEDQDRIYARAVDSSCGKKERLPLRKTDDANVRSHLFVERASVGSRETHNVSAKCFSRTKAGVLTCLASSLRNVAATPRVLHALNPARCRKDSRCRQEIQPNSRLLMAETL